LYKNDWKFKRHPSCRLVQGYDINLALSSYILRWSNYIYNFAHCHNEEELEKPLATCEANYDTKLGCLSNTASNVFVKSHTLIQYLELDVRGLPANNIWNGLLLRLFDNLADFLSYAVQDEEGRAAF